MTKIIPISLLVSYLMCGCISFRPGDIEAAIPRPTNNIKSGRIIASQIKNLDEYSREIFLLREFRRGNIPEFMRYFKAIPVNARLNNGKTISGKIWVSPDYLALGTDSDYIRFPMNPITAQKIADHYACILPTSKIVDLIYKSAQRKLKPITFAPGPHMVTTQQYLRHNRAIQIQLSNYPHSILRAGHKKDLVITNRLLRKKRRVAIYGWHRLNGKPIQPLSTIHGNYYADYSHGVRLVHNMMEIDGNPVPVAEVLQDPSLSSIISYEGTIRRTRYATEGSWQRKRWTPMQ